jgi:predicted metal-dependent hydrolase
MAKPPESSQSSQSLQPPQSPKPLEPIVLSLIHTPTLRDAIQAQSEGFDLRWLLDIKGIDKHEEPGRREVAGIADLQPALILIEVDQSADWLPRVRSDPATRRIPVLAIADDDDAERRAMAARVDAILTTDAFLNALPGILREYARVFDASDALNAQCAESPPPLVIKGLHEFNAQEYFECHETLEEAWMKESGPVRDVYRAILQVGIAYYQIQRGNYWGAHKMFVRSLQWFAPLPDRCQGIDIATLRADAAAARAHLETLGPERIKEFDVSLFKPLIYEEPS